MKQISPADDFPPSPAVIFTNIVRLLSDSFQLGQKRKKKILTRTSSREVIEDRTTEQDKGKWWSGDAEPVARCYAQCCRWLPDSIPEKAIIIIIAFVLAYDVCFWWE